MLSTGVRAATGRGYRDAQLPHRGGVQRREPAGPSGESPPSPAGLNGPSAWPTSGPAGPTAASSRAPPSPAAPIDLQRDLRSGGWWPMPADLTGPERPDDDPRFRTDLASTWAVCSSTNWASCWARCSRRPGWRSCTSCPSAARPGRQLPRSELSSLEGRRQSGRNRPIEGLVRELRLFR
jgi:hypothetical protein